MPIIRRQDFTITRRSASREINRWIALNLIREQQPVSRADLARRMETTRSHAGLLVNELIGEGLVREGAKGEGARGPQTSVPVLTRSRSTDRCGGLADQRVLLSALRFDWP